jgi:hypothetical protein
MAKKYNWKKTFKKGVIAFLYGGIAELIVFVSGLNQEFAPVILAVLYALQNYLKNYRK